jgi:hypothetical protein
MRVLESVLYAEDLVAARQFYVDILALEEIMFDENRDLFLRCEGSVVILFTAQWAPGTSHSQRVKRKSRLGALISTKTVLISSKRSIGRTAQSRFTLKIRLATSSNLQPQAFGILRTESLIHRVLLRRAAGIIPSRPRFDLIYLRNSSAQERQRFR